MRSLRRSDERTPSTNPTSLSLPFLSSLRTRGSSVVVLYRCPSACGRGCAPVPSMPYGGEDCLSAASSAAHTPGTGAQAPPLGGHARAPLVLGSFAETKEPRRAGPKPRRRKERKGGHPGPPLRTGTRSRRGRPACRPASFQITPPQTLDPRSWSGMTTGEVGDDRKRQRILSTN